MGTCGAIIESNRQPGEVSGKEVLKALQMGRESRGKDGYVAADRTNGRPKTGGDPLDRDQTLLTGGGIFS